MERTLAGAKKIPYEETNSKVECYFGLRNLNIGEEAGPFTGT